MKGKVQTNEYGNNILVETETSKNRHTSSLDFAVECEILSDKEIKVAFLKIQPDITLQEMKNFLKSKDGFAISTCTERLGNEDSDYVAGLDYGTLVTFKRI